MELVPGTHSSFPRLTLDDRSAWCRGWGWCTCGHRGPSAGDRGPVPGELQRPDPTWEKKEEYL